MPPLILVVDDEPKVARLACDYLEKNGYRTTIARDGETALAMARRDRPDLIILDLMLPGLDGREVCRRLRRESDVPIIMLTALSEEIDQVTGLEIGADDYVTKPFSVRQLVARVRALLRRSQGDVRVPRVVRIGALEVDPDRHVAVCNGAPIRLTPNEFKLLYLLAERPGQLFSREQLVEALHGTASSLDRSVDSHIKNLRKKLEAACGQTAGTHLEAPRIETVYGVGYRLIEPGA